MSLIFHAHPLSSYCWKALIALYEKELDFEFRLLDLGDPDSRAAFAALWPIAKMPVLEDADRGAVVPETSIIVDYLDAHHPGAIRLVPEEADAARDVRLWDRIFDLYVQGPMQRIVGDRLRPADKRDAFGVEEARAALATALNLVEREAAGRARPWARGEAFTLADCAAAPALFYADKVMPLAGTWPEALALLERLKARPSVARVLVEAGPWLQYFPAG
jgi:glutathione S-transferase